MAMLRYGQDPEGTMKYLRRELNLRFNHSRVMEGRKPTHPTKLSENLISFETMKRIAFSDRNNLQGVEDRGLARLEAEKLNEIRLRDLLGRLRRPDLPGLPALILKDLKNKHSRGFGSHVYSQKPHQGANGGVAPARPQVHRQFELRTFLPLEIGPFRRRRPQTERRGDEKVAQPATWLHPTAFPGLQFPQGERHARIPGLPASRGNGIARPSSNTSSFPASPAT